MLPSIIIMTTANQRALKNKNKKMDQNTKYTNNMNHLKQKRIPFVCHCFSANKVDHQDRKSLHKWCFLFKQKRKTNENSSVNKYRFTAVMFFFFIMYVATIPLVVAKWQYFLQWGQNQIYFERMSRTIVHFTAGKSVILQCCANKYERYSCHSSDIRIVNRQDSSALLTANETNSPLILNSFISQFIMWVSYSGIHLICSWAIFYLYATYLYNSPSPLVQ